MKSCIFTRFVKKTCITPTCWIWLGARNHSGYGICHLDGIKSSAHRLSYRLFLGAYIPPKTMVLHKCDNPTCVNPEHLYLGTAVENGRDKIGKTHLRDLRPDRLQSGKKFII